MEQVRAEYEALSSTKGCMGVQYIVLTTFAC